MNEIKIFNYNGVNGLRAIIIDNDPWFVAKDACDFLELGDVSKAVSRLDEDEKGTNLIPTRGGNQEMLCVNESGLYNLILGSRKQEAKQFKRWVTHEVLPAIRKTGQYIAKPASQIEALLQTVQLLAEQDKAIKQIAATQANIQEAVQVAHHRIDSLDACNIDGNLQQRFNAMIRKYATKNGILFNKAWGEFKSAFDLAFHTNIGLRISNYKEKHGLKQLTAPQYLSLTNQLEDAIRVADKMLNKTA